MTTATAERSVVEVLRAARERISDPERWATGEFAYRSDDPFSYCAPNSPGACKWCLAGAVFAELDLRDGVGLALDQVPAIKLLAKAAVPSARIATVNTAVEVIAAVNDGHTHKWVLDVADRAIALAEAEA